LLKTHSTKVSTNYRYKWNKKYVKQFMNKSNVSHTGVSIILSEQPLN